MNCFIKGNLKSTIKFKKLNIIQQATPHKETFQNETRSTSLIKSACLKILVLLVCTDDFNRLISRTVFYDLDDCEVSTTTNPRYAYKLFCNYLTRNNPFDIVFLDYLLPPINGITLGRKFRDLYPAVKLEFFASLYFNDKSIRDTYIEMFGYYKKPVYSFDQMEAALDAILQEKKQNRSNPDCEK